MIDFRPAVFYGHLAVYVTFCAYQFKIIICEDVLTIYRKRF